jgi:glyoxylase-like metal-dependent hydrolase (beta-lactamase superfamily II)
MSEGRPFSSRHFRLEELASGVFAAIHIDGGAAIGNAGIVDLGDRTLVYDSTFTPQAGEDLRIVAEALTGRPVDAVINSHYHNDHIWGNQSFGPETDIIASEETWRLIVHTGGHDDYKSFAEAAEGNLASTLAAYQATKDEGDRRQLAVWLDYHRAFVEAKPDLQVRAPNLTFSQRLAFHGTERSAELMAFDRGHSPSDAVLFLPEAGIAFLSDLLFIDYHPWVGAGDPDGLSDILQEVYELGPQVVVPGHGPVGGLDSLQVMRQYISGLDGLADEMVESGVPEERIDEIAVPEPFAGWLFAAFFPLNLNFVYRRRLERHAKDAN